MHPPHKFISTGYNLDWVMLEYQQKRPKSSKSTSEKTKIQKSTSDDEKKTKIGWYNTWMHPLSCQTLHSSNTNKKRPKSWKSTSDFYFFIFFEINSLWCKNLSHNACLSAEISPRKVEVQKTWFWDYLFPFSGPNSILTSSSQGSNLGRLI